MKLSISLAGAKPKPTPTGTAPPLARPAAFGALEDDAADTADAAPTAGSSRGGVAANKAHLAHAVGAPASRAQRKRMDAERRVDASVFEYDEVYDSMQAAKERSKAAKEVDSAERKPKYISGLLNSAATRRLDRLRAEEKMLQREREAEGDEYAGKEEFVTQAYKDQMAEVRRAEEEETAREEAEKKKRGGQPAGLARFYQQMLNQSDTQHQEAVAATLKTAQGPAEPAPSAATNLTILRPPAAGAAPGPAPAPAPDLARKNDLQLAQEAGAQGKNVELNDDNQIVDKRELLSAGLNLSAPNTRRLGIGRAAAGAGAADAPVQTHRAVGAAASRREINERRAREVQTQLRQEEERVAQEREREEAERLQRVVAKRNQDTDVQDARERYLARKRRKLEQPDGAAPEAVA